MLHHNTPRKLGNANHASCHALAFHDTLPSFPLSSLSVSTKIGARRSAEAETQIARHTSRWRFRDAKRPNSAKAKKSEDGLSSQGLPLFARLFARVVVGKRPRLRPPLEPLTVFCERCYGMGFVWKENLFVGRFWDCALAG